MKKSAWVLAAATSFVTTMLTTLTVSANRWLPWGPQSDHGRIYGAIGSFGRPAESFGPTKMEKSVGGLVCSQFGTIGNGGAVYYEYECKLAKRGRDDEAIYHALGVAPVRDKKSSHDEIVDVKTVDDLTCRETRAEGKTASYSCRLR